MTWLLQSALIDEGNTRARRFVNHIGFYNSSTVRPDLLAAYERWRGDKQKVVVNGLLHRSDRMSKVEYQKLLWASEFGLLPRGDER